MGGGVPGREEGRMETGRGGKKQKERREAGKEEERVSSAKGPGRSCALLPATGVKMDAAPFSHLQCFQVPLILYLKLMSSLVGLEAARLLFCLFQDPLSVSQIPSVPKSGMETPSKCPDKVTVEVLRGLLQRIIRGERRHGVLLISQDFIINALAAGSRLFLTSVLPVPVSSSLLEHALTGRGYRIQEMKLHICY